MTAPAHAAEDDTSGSDAAEKVASASIALGTEGVSATVTGENSSWDLTQDWFAKRFTLGEHEKLGELHLTAQSAGDNNKITLSDDGSIGISFTKSDDQKLVFHQLSFEMTGGTFSNSTNIEFTDQAYSSGEKTEEAEGRSTGIEFNVSGGTFTNTGSIVFTGYDVKIDNAVTSNQTTEDAGSTSSSVSFDGSKGSLTFKDSSFTIGHADTSAPVFDHGEEPKESLAFGDVTLENTTLTNYDAGYVEKAEADTESEETQSGETHTRVSFGDVIVGAKSSFQSLGAGETGESLTVKAGEGASAKFNKTGLSSDWGSVTLDFTPAEGAAQSSYAALTIGAGSTVSVGTLSLIGISGNTTLTSAVSIDSTSKLSLSSGLSLDEFSNNAVFELSDATLTNIALADGLAVTAGHDLTVEQVKPTNDEEKRFVIEKQEGGTLQFTGFRYTKTEQTTDGEKTLSGDADDSQNTNIHIGPLGT